MAFIGLKCCFIYAGCGESWESRFATSGAFSLQLESMVSSISVIKLHHHGVRVLRKWVSNPHLYFGM